MAIDILTNGSRRANRRILDLLTARPANLVTVSVYGASAESYDGLTRRPGSYKTFMKGLQAAHEAGVRLALALIVVERNAHEAGDRKALAARFGVPTKTYSHITPTIYGGAETLPSQSPEYLVPRIPAVDVHPESQRGGESIEVIPQILRGPPSPPEQLLQHHIAAPIIQHTVPRPPGLSERQRH